MVIWSLVIIAAVVLILFLLNKVIGSSKTKMSTKFVTEVGIAAALSIALWFLKVFEMPNGGSISLEAIPILFLAFKKGYKEGIFAGLIAGIIQLLITGFKFHPIQIIMDYPLALASLGIAGLWTIKLKSKVNVVLGVTTGFIMKLFFHTLSGAIFFAEYAPEGVSPWIYSVGYNATYIVPELIICVILFFYLSTKGILKE